MNKTKKELTKSHDKIVSGVFGGVAEYFGWDKSLTRLIGLVLLIFPGHIIFGLLAYLGATIIIPDAPTKDTVNGQAQASVLEGEFKEKQ